MPLGVTTTESIFLSFLISLVTVGVDFSALYVLLLAGIALFDDITQMLTAKTNASKAEPVVSAHFGKCALDIMGFISCQYISALSIGILHNELKSRADFRYVGRFSIGATRMQANISASISFCGEFCSCPNK